MISDYQHYSNPTPQFNTGINFNKLLHVSKSEVLTSKTEVKIMPISQEMCEN